MTEKLDDSVPDELVAVTNSPGVRRILDMINRTIKSLARKADGKYDYTNWQDVNKNVLALRDQIAEELSAARTVEDPVTAKIWIGCQPKTRLPGWRTEHETEQKGSHLEFEKASSWGSGTSLRKQLDSIFDHCNFHTQHWVEKVEEYMSKNQRTKSGARIWVDDDYNWRGMNQPKPVNGRDSQFLGYGGSPWHVEFFDGTKFTSNDVWFGGTVPTLYRNLIKPNGRSVAATK